VSCWRDAFACVGANQTHAVYPFPLLSPFRVSSRIQHSALLRPRLQHSQCARAAPLYPAPLYPRRLEVILRVVWPIFGCKQVPTAADCGLCRSAAVQTLRASSISSRYSSYFPGGGALWWLCTVQLLPTWRLATGLLHRETVQL